MTDTRSLESAVIIPFLQSGISAGIAALAVGAVGRMADLQTWREAATLGAACAGGSVWFWQLKTWTDCVKLEAGWLAGVNEPAPEPAYYEPAPAPVEPLQVHLHSEDNKTIEILDLPVDVDRLAQLAAAVINVGPEALSEAQWTGSGGIFTRGEFQKLRTELVRRGLLAWNLPGTPQRGLSITRPGRAAFRHFASLAHQGPGAVKAGGE